MSKTTLAVEVPDLPNNFALMSAIKQVVDHFVRNKEMDNHKVARVLEYMVKETEAR